MLPGTAMHLSAFALLAIPREARLACVDPIRESPAQVSFAGYVFLSSRCLSQEGRPS
jgi:hypothetical protein